jgi:LytS/YehU family sensor histidine kinase
VYKRQILKNYKNRLVVIFISGSFIFLTGAVLAMYFRNVVYMMYGAAIEVFIFSLGLGYKSKQIETEKKRIESEMNRVKLTALRAQMNPHFLFNSLNSIRAYVISNKVKEASEYLSKFASLIRLILNYSSKEHIELYEELEALKLYVQLEELRFRQNFGLKIIHEENIDLHNVLIPPLILQPYVENAIRHGLAPAKETNSLEIKISVENDNQMIISVRDNGVGRTFSKKLNTIQNPEHKSLAMELTRSRIELMDSQSKIYDQVVVVDHYDNNTPKGTEVIIKIPVKHKKYET